MGVPVTDRGNRTKTEGGWQPGMNCLEATHTAATGNCFKDR